jgi:hypothetical protein
MVAMPPEVRSRSTARRVQILYDVPDADERWVLEDDDNVPESSLHDDIVLLLVEILRAWAQRGGRDARVGRNLALRWDQARPRVGVDPDVYVVEPAPPEEDINSLCTWKPGHVPPRVAIEVVSENNADKDYAEGPEKYGASGTGELWVFDPLLAGPALRGGPFVLQVWRRDPKGPFRRVYAGAGPARSDALGAWIVVTDEGRRLRVADDAEGRQLWPTEAEEARAETEQARTRAAEADARAAEANAEIARLRAEIARLRGG